MRGAGGGCEEGGGSGGDLMGSGLERILRVRERRVIMKRT